MQISSENGHFLRRRPALVSAILFASGIILARYSEISWPILSGAAFILLAASFPAKNDRLRNLSLAAALCACGAALFSFRYVDTSEDNIRRLAAPNERITIYGWVRGQEFSPYGLTKYVVDVDSVLRGGSALPAYGSVLITRKGIDRQPRYGSSIITEETFSTFTQERNPGELDFDRYYRYRGIHGYMEVDQGSLLFPENPGRGLFIMREVVIPARWKLIESVRRNFSGKSEQVLLALLFGERGFIEPELRDAFAETGAVHLLAVSGLHTGYIILMLTFVITFIRLKGNARIFFIIAGLVFYVLLTGSVPSVFRAAVIGGAMTTAYYLERRADFWNALGFAALVILLFRPADLFAVGFQLSFAAVSAIILAGSIMNGLREKRNPGNKFFAKRWVFYCVSAFAVSLAVTLFLAPLSGYYFQRIPLSIVLLNVALVPLTGLIVSVGFFSLLLGLFSPVAAQPFNTSLDVFLKLLVSCVEFFSALNFSTIPVSRYQALWGALLLAAVLLFIVFHKRGKPGYYLIGVLAVANGFVLHGIYEHRAPGIDLLVFDIGQGTAVMATFPAGQRMLFDAGDIRGSYADPYSPIVGYCKREGIRKLDKVFISHPDKDHTAGLLPLMRSVAIDSIFVGPGEGTSLLAKLLYRRADSLDIPIKKIYAGELLASPEGSRIYLLHPSRQWSVTNRSASSNNQSLVLKIIMGNSSALLPGDAEYPAEYAVLQFPAFLPSDILIAGHHGSITSSSGEFLVAVRPEYAVISAGADNRFGHPSPIVLARLGKIGAKITRTDVSGAARFYLSADTVLQIR